MSDECIYADDIREVTPSALGCEECLKIGSPWVHLRLCGPAAMSAVATIRRTAMPPSIFTRRAIRSSKAMTRPKAGGGVTSTKLCSTSAIAPPRTTARSRAFTELAYRVEGTGIPLVWMRLERPFLYLDHRVRGAAPQMLRCSNT